MTEKGVITHVVLRAKTGREQGIETRVIRSARKATAGTILPITARPTGVSFDHGAEVESMRSHQKESTYPD